MSYTTTIEGFEGQNIEVTVSFWSGPKLLINGVPAQKGSKRGELLLQRNDGRQVTATWKPQILGFDVPQLVVDGKTINLVQPLPWYQWIWGGLPILLVFMGGALGAVAGLVAFSVNARLFRSDLNDLMKYLATGAVSAAAVIIYFVVAVAFTLLIQG